MSRGWWRWGALVSPDGVALWHPPRWSMCLPLLIFPCTIKSRSSLLAPAHPGGPGKRAVKQLCVCVSFFRFDYCINPESSSNWNNVCLLHRLLMLEANFRPVLFLFRCCNAGIPFCKLFVMFWSAVPLCFLLSSCYPGNKQWAVPGSNNNTNI